MRKLNHCQQYIAAIKKISQLMWLLVLLAFYSALGIAQEFSALPHAEIQSGMLFFKGNSGYYPELVQASDYNVEVNGLTARISLTQSFVNNSEQWLEAIYVFPLNQGSAVDSMMMEIGERRIVGKIKEKFQAKKLYQSAKRAGKIASLVSQQRPNMFTSKVANIAPKQTIKVDIDYIQVIDFSDDRFSLRIPLTITPRFIPQANSATGKKLLAGDTGFSVNEKGNDVSKSEPILIDSTYGWAKNNARVPDASEITPVQARYDMEQPHQKATIDIRLNAGLALQGINSKNHIIKQYKVPDAGDVYHIKLASTQVAMDSDFELNWRLGDADVPSAAFFQSTDADSNYGLLMVMPPKLNQSLNIAKEVTYVIDTSGSMGGVAIAQAKSALSYALSLLDENDSFNIIAFNDQASQLFPKTMPLTERSLEWALQWVDALHAGGGTQMYQAIELALSQQDTSQGDGAYQQVIFITDGAVGNEEELLSLIELKLATRRLHTIGIGSAPNGYFMSRAAEVGRGTYRFISNINYVQQKMRQLFHDINQPLLRDISIDWPSEQVEIYPQNIPDLYAGQPLLISAKWPKSVMGDINLSGLFADSMWQQKVLVNRAKKQSGISTWWARSKIKQLNHDYRRVAQHDKARLKAEITMVALQHQLLSPFTSFIAIEEKISRQPNSSLSSQAIANAMPKGSAEAIPLANTASGHLIKLYIGLVVLSFAIFLNLLGKCHLFMQYRAKS